MKLYNNNIREILERSGKISTPLDHGEVYAQYQLLLSKIQLESAPVKSSLFTYYPYKNIFFKLAMMTPKQILTTAIAITITTGTFSVGYAQALAHNLALEIKNAPNAYEYPIDYNFKDVLLNGKSVKKEYVLNLLKTNEKINLIGNTSGSEIKSYSAEQLILERNVIIDNNTTNPEQEYTSFSVNQDKDGDWVVSDKTSNSKIEELISSNETPGELIMEGEIGTTKYPFGQGFEESTKFLELKKDKEINYIGVNKNGEIAFFASVSI